MLEEDYTNILRKLEYDLPPYFEDITLRNMTFLVIIIRYIGRANNRVSCVDSQRGQV